jgi:glycerate-2-kinase
MAVALVDGGVSPACGVVAGPRIGSRRLPGHLDWYEAAHPRPDNASVAAAERALSIASEQRDTTTLVVLLSGGASAMLSAPASGVSLADKVATTTSLLSAGVPIAGLNCVRKHLSRIKGGRLATAARRTITLAISDVHTPVADDPSTIGSGPTVADPSTYAHAQAVIAASGAAVPEAIAAHLDRGARGEIEETVKPGDPRLAESLFLVIGNRHAALEGAMRAAQARGYSVITIPDATSGEARTAGQEFLSHGRWLASDVPRPVCVLASGETTVAVRGGGRGGRNQEFALAAAPTIASAGRAAVMASVGTDGIDGPTDAAGALVDSATLDRAQRAGVDWEAALAANDAYRFFEPLGDLIKSGPTGTNVGDLHVLLIA